MQPIRSRELESSPSSCATVSAVVLTVALIGACQRARSHLLAGAASDSVGSSVVAAVAASGSAASVAAVETPSAAPASESPSAPSTAACPDGMVTGDGCCIDRYEAHLIERVGDEIRQHPHNQRPGRGVRYEARSERGVFPQAYISRDEAAAACENAGKRLCTAKEWYTACSAPDGRTYPYGARFVAGACNVGKAHLLTRYYGPDPRGWRYDENFNDPRLDVEPGFLAKTGDYERCVSAAGVADMVGNLHEWVADRVDRTLPGKFPLIEALLVTVPRNHGHGVFLGGFFSTSHEHGFGCRFATLAHEPGYHDYSTGFRCCRDAGPEPRPAAEAPR